ncbi:hypothetical protein D3C80_2095310 [compost metagenome]
MKGSIRATADLALHWAIKALDFLRISCQDGIVTLVEQLHRSLTSNRSAPVHCNYSVRTTLTNLSKILR